jgi:methylthioribose-1-phosphate isomerase
VITFCTCPVIAVATQSGLSEDTTHLTKLPSGIYVEEQDWMEINKRHSKDYITDFESIMAVPEHDITTLDRIKGYFTEKQPLTPEQDTAKNS